MRLYIPGAGSFRTIREVYGFLSGDNSILLKKGSLVEDALLDREWAVSLTGGYDPGGGNADYSVIYGSLRVRAGRVRLDHLRFLTAP